MAFAFALCVVACGGKSEQEGHSPSAGGSRGAPSCGAGPIGYERRLCRTAADCVIQTVPSCCGPDAVMGIAAEQLCTPEPQDCDLLDCVHSPGFLTDDNQLTLDRATLTLACEVGEPGAGLCRTSVELGSGDSFVCGDVMCPVTEMCVHNEGTPRPPLCTPVPPGCGAPLACPCLPFELCGSPESLCTSVRGRDVYCFMP